MVYPKKQESATGRSATGETRFSKAKIEVEPQGNARPRVVSMTANAMEGDRELCLEAGMELRFQTHPRGAAGRDADTGCNQPSGAQAGMA